MGHCGRRCPIAPIRLRGVQSAQSALVEYAEVEVVTALHVGTLGPVFEPVAIALEAVVEELHDRALVTMDAKVRPAAIADAQRYRDRLDRVFARSDVVTVSEDDLACLDPDRASAPAARALPDHGPSVVLLTRGAEGALVVTADREVAVPAPQVAVVDTIGAGDAFGGGFVAWWHARGRPRRPGRRRARRRGDAIRRPRRAKTCERPGALPPRLEELE